MKQRHKETFSVSFATKLLIIVELWPLVQEEVQFAVMLNTKHVQCAAMLKSKTDVDVSSDSFISLFVFVSVHSELLHYNL